MSFLCSSSLHNISVYHGKVPDALLVCTEQCRFLKLPDHLLRLDYIVRTTPIRLFEALAINDHWSTTKRKTKDLDNVVADDYFVPETMVRLCS